MDKTNSIITNKPGKEQQLPNQPSSSSLFFSLSLVFWNINDWRKYHHVMLDKHDMACLFIFKHKLYNTKLIL